MQNNLVMTSSPHLRDHSSTQRIMQEVCLALLPAGIAGVIIFGWSALMLICVSVATCVLSEFVWEKLTKRTVTIGDWSAVVTGLLLAYNLPANAPWWLAVVGGVIAIILVKQMFGGIGSNFMNPALTARAILFVSWSALMSSYPQSNFVVDATTSATPLGLLSKGVSGVNFMDLLLGNCGGVLGETCKLAILVGGIYLCVRKIADWRIPVSFIGYGLGIRSIGGYLCMFFYILATVIRLGYFNVQEMNRVQQEGEAKRKYYTGLPVTNVSLLIPCFILLDIFTKRSFIRLYNIALLLIGMAFLSKIKVRKLYLHGLIVVACLSSIVFFLIFRYGGNIICLPVSTTPV